MTLMRKRRKEMAPGMVIILSYSLFILVGGILLALPIAHRGEAVSFLDGLFTATSAMCVTGLTVVDTGTRFSLFGQTVILLLVQVGGLGITTFSVYLFFYLRLGVGLRGRWIINETLHHTPVDSLRDLIGSIFRLTLAIEMVGAVLLACVFVPQEGWWQGCYSAVFHSVSAFCNAGFSLYPDSLTRFRGDVLVNATVIFLVILGGIGFLVMRELLALRHGGQVRRLTLHTKLVLVTSAVLVVAGTAFIVFLEHDNALRGLTLWDGFWASLFQSVVMRTAGFNTIDPNLFAPATILFVMLLMFIGGSPGSCAGGIKTTSLAVFYAIVSSRLRGNPHTNVFRRTITNDVVTKTLTLTLLAGLVVGTAIFFLLSVHGFHDGVRVYQGLIFDYAFEAVSAFGTVGLSLGITPQLGAVGKIIILLLMFVGRVGLLTVVFVLAGRTRGDAVEYGEENIMVG